MSATSDTRPCDSCGVSLLAFEGFDDWTTCGECSTRKARLTMPEPDRLHEWLEVMEWLDQHGVETGTVSRSYSALERLEMFLDQERT